MLVKKFGAKFVFLCTVVLLLVSLFPAYSSAAKSDPTVEDYLKQSATQKQTSTQGTDSPTGGTNAWPGSSAPSGWGLLLQMVFSLGFVLLLIYVVFRFLGKRQLSGLKQQGALKAIGGIPLGNGKSLQVVQVGDSLYILGVGDNVQLLRHIPAGDEMDVLLADLEIKPTAETSLSTWLGFLRRDKQDDVLLHSGHADRSFEQLLEQQWNEVKRQGSEQAGWGTDNKQRGNDL